MQRLFASNTQKGRDRLIQRKKYILSPLGTNRYLHKRIEVIREQLKSVVDLLLRCDFNPVAALFEPTQRYEVGSVRKGGEAGEIVRCRFLAAGHQYRACFLHVVEQGKKGLDLTLGDIVLTRIASDVAPCRFASRIEAQSSAALPLVAFGAACIENDRCFCTDLLFVLGRIKIWNQCEKPYAHHKRKLHSFKIGHLFLLLKIILFFGGFGWSISGFGVVEKTPAHNI